MVFVQIHFRLTSKDITAVRDYSILASYIACALLNWRDILYIPYLIEPSQQYITCSVLLCSNPDRSRAHL